jgi:hypothetical protein
MLISRKVNLEIFEVYVEQPLAVVYPAGSMSKYDKFKFSLTDWQNQVTIAKYHGELIYHHSFWPPMSLVLYLESELFVGRHQRGEDLCQIEPAVVAEHFFK